MSSGAAAEDGERRAERGRRGEAVAQALLEGRGYRIVDVNVRLGARRDGLPGEIDIVAWDGPTLCFIEVKTRRCRAGAAALAADTPAESVTPAKQRQIARLALAYAARHGLLTGAEEVPFRFDVVSILQSSADPPQTTRRIPAISSSTAPTCTRAPSSPPTISPTTEASPPRFSAQKEKRHRPWQWCCGMVYCVCYPR